MLRRFFLLLSALSLAACDVAGRAADCAPCAEPAAETPAERAARAYAEKDPDNIAMPSTPFLNRWGKDDSFCAGLPELTRAAVRARMIELGHELSPEVGMSNLIVCQSYYREDELAMLNAYRLLTYLDVKEEMDGPSETIDTFRQVVATILYDEYDDILDQAEGVGVFLNRDLLRLRPNGDKPTDVRFSTRERGRNNSDLYWKRNSQIDNEEDGK